MAILLSLVAHAAIGVAMWPRLENEDVEILDIGEGHDIVLMPQGIVMNEVSNRGEDVETIETPPLAAVPVQQPKPTQPTTLSPKPLSELAGAVERQDTHDVATLPAQKPVAQRPTLTSSEALLDVPNDSGTPSTPVATALREQEPTTKPPLASTPEPAHDVANATVSKAIEAVAPVRAQTPAPERISATETEQVRDVSVPRKRAIKPDIEPATDTPSLDPLKEPSSGKTGDLPPPDQLKESAVVQADAPSPPQPVKEQAPPLKTAIAYPDQVAIVTEQSSGAQRSGGDARVVGIYLGKVNERVQNSKINPRSQATGTVVLKYTVGIDGSLLSKEITSSSKFEILDHAALAALTRAAPFPPIPPEVSLRPMTFTQSFRFIVR